MGGAESHTFDNPSALEVLEGLRVVLWHNRKQLERFLLSQQLTYLRIYLVSKVKDGRVSTGCANLRIVCADGDFDADAAGFEIGKGNFTLKVNDFTDQDRFQEVDSIHGFQVKVVGDCPCVFRFAVRLQSVLDQLLHAEVRTAHSIHHEIAPENRPCSII